VHLYIGNGYIIGAVELWLVVVVAVGLALLGFVVGRLSKSASATSAESESWWDSPHWLALGAVAIVVMVVLVVVFTA
jgi:hypothetical protein